MARSHNKTVKEMVEEVANEWGSLQSEERYVKFDSRREVQDFRKVVRDSDNYTIVKYSGRKVVYRPVEMPGFDG